MSARKAFHCLAPAPCGSSRTIARSRKLFSGDSQIDKEGGKGEKVKEVNQYLLCSFLLLNCNTKSKDQIAHKTFSKRFIFPDEVTRKMESETVAIVSCLRMLA